MVALIRVLNFIYSQLLLSRSPRDSEIIQDICSSKYQICRIEEKIHWTAKFNKSIYNLSPEVRDILEQFLLFSTIFCYLLLDFHVKTGTRFSLRDKQLLKISKVKITRLDCILLWVHRQLTELANLFTKMRMLACVGHRCWRKLEYPEKITSRG